MKRRSCRSYVTPALLCWSVACGPPPASPSEHHIDGDIDNGRVPDITLEPGELDFGLVDLMPPSEVSKDLEICNLGDADLHIQNIELEENAGSFSFGLPESVLVPPQACTHFSAFFRPSGPGDHEDYVVVDSDDPDRPVALALLLGRGGPSHRAR